MKGRAASFVSGSPCRKELTAVPWPEFAGAARLRARGHGGRQGETQAEEELTARLMKVISETGSGTEEAATEELHRAMELPSSS